MKKATLILAICALALSCEEKNSEGLIGKWELTEHLIDIGDGKGTFVKANPGKTIEFRKDGTVASNGTLCGVGDETGMSSTGTYSEESGEIKPDQCETRTMPIKFQLKGNELIINYPCIEPCAEKYRKAS